MRKTYLCLEILSRCLNERDKETKGFSQKREQNYIGMKNDENLQKIICYECRKFGHIRLEYPKLKKKLRFKKKSLMATKKDSSLASNSRLVVEHANLYPMTNAQEEVIYNLTPISIQI